MKTIRESNENMETKMSGEGYIDGEREVQMFPEKYEVVYSVQTKKRRGFEK